MLLKDQFLDTMVPLMIIFLSAQGYLGHSKDRGSQAEEMFGQEKLYDNPNKSKCPLNKNLALSNLTVISFECKNMKFRPYKSFLDL